MTLQMQRLRRIERVRDIARQSAARDAAEAEATRAQLSALAERTGDLAADYARTDAADTGAALALAARFAGSLQSLRRTTTADADHAQDIAEQRLAALAEAERRRAAIGERISAGGARSLRPGRSLHRWPRAGAGTILDRSGP